MYSLPSNPAANYYLTTCYVCQEKASPEDPHSLHYGGVVCLCCRAFFRRAHQKTKTPNFTCKKGGMCEVTVKNRRRCQLCRYKKCLAAGMRPDAVLTAEQKTVRFRKMLYKRNREKAGTDQQQAGPSTQRGSRQRVEQLQQRQHQPGNPGTPNHCSQQTGQDYEEANEADWEADYDPYDGYNEASYDTNESYYPSSKQAKWKEEEEVEEVDQQEAIDRLMESMAYGVIHSFRLTIAQQDSLDKQADFVARFFMLHSRKVACVSGNEVINYFCCMAKQFRHFAILQQDFSRLPKNEQLYLLTMNTTLVVHFSILRYLGVKSIADQNSLFRSVACWRLPNVKQTEIILDDFNPISRMDLTIFNRLLHLWKQDVDIERLAYYVDQWPDVMFSSLRHNAFLNLIFLFHRSNHAMPLRRHLIRMLEKELNLCSLESLIELVCQFSDYSSQFIRWNMDQRDSILHCAQLVPKYCSDEESWLQNRLRLYDEANSSVQMGKAIVDEVIMYNLDVPLSKKFMPLSVSMMCAKMRKVMMEHSEFCDLPPSLQRDLLMANVPLATTLFCFRVENMPSNYDQRRLCFGAQDKITFHVKTQCRLENVRAQAITMQDLFAQQCIDVDPKDLDSFNRSMKKYKFMVLNDDPYKLIIMLLLLRPPDHWTRNSFNEELYQIFDKYFSLFLRRRQLTRSAEVADALYSRDNLLCLFNDVIKASGVVKKLASSYG